MTFKPHHTPHAVTGELLPPEWPTVDTTVPEQDPLTVIVKATTQGGWTATATFAEFSAEHTALGPCEAAQEARARLLLLLLTPESER